MAAIELDPVFVRALRLLHSKSKDSTAQLKQMLEQTIAAKKGLGPGPSAKSPNGSVHTSRSVSIEKERKEERGEKSGSVSSSSSSRDLDRLKADLSQIMPKSGDLKRPRLDSPALSHSSNESPGSPWEGESAASSPGEFRDIELDCTCIVCKSFNQESNNKLMECSACQNLYHQECHEPPVSNSEASDPRLIWHCSRCSRKSKNPASSSSSSSRSASVEKGGGEKAGKTAATSTSSHKHHKPSPSKVGSKLKSSSHHSSSNSGSGSSAGNQGSIHLSEAQKRIKLMKKQAAAASMGKKKAK